MANQSAGGAVSARVYAFQIKTLVLIILAGTVNIMDRATLAIGNPLIRADLGLSLADMGLLLSAFLWAYAWRQLPLGFLIDRAGPRRALGWGSPCGRWCRASPGWSPGSASSSPCGCCWASARRRCSPPPSP